MPPETKDRVNRPVDWLNKFALAAAARGLFVKLDSDGEIETTWVQPFFVDVNNTQVLNGTLAYLRDITNQNDTARITPTPKLSTILDSISGLVVNNRDMKWAAADGSAWPGGWVADIASYKSDTTSAAHAAQSVTLDPPTVGSARNNLDIISICSAGTATLVVEVSTDNVTWLQIDSIAAAATIVQHYDATVVGTGTYAVCPLGFPRIKITAGDAGVGNTTRLRIVSH